MSSSSSSCAAIPFDWLCAAPVRGATSAIRSKREVERERLGLADVSKGAAPTLNSYVTSASALHHAGPDAFTTHTAERPRSLSTLPLRLSADRHAPSVWEPLLCLRLDDSSSLSYDYDRQASLIAYSGALLAVLSSTLCTLPLPLPSRSRVRGICESPSFSKVS